MLRIIIYISLFGFLLSSCGSKFSLQKKRYSKGFYFSSVSNKTSPTKVIKSEETISKTEVQVEYLQKQEIKSENISTQDLIKTKEEKKPIVLLAAINNTVKKSILNPIKNFDKTGFKKLNYSEFKKSYKSPPSDVLGCMENVITGAYIIYVLVAAAAFLWFLYEALPLNQFLLAVGICVIVLLLCYGVGSLVT